MKNFIVQNSFITFAALEPAKPLNDAQIGGSFFLLNRILEQVLPKHILLLNKSFRY